MLFSFKPNYQFLNNEMLFRDNESTPYSENVTFLIDLIRFQQYQSPTFAPEVNC